MAFNPNNNPATHKELAGKLHRHAVNTSCVRTLRTDPEAERSLQRIRTILSRGIDAPSFSLIVRRSLNTYCKTLEATAPGGVEVERRMVRVASHLPRL